MGNRALSLGGYTLPKTDLIRFFVIISFSVSATLISALAFSSSIPYIHYQLFFIPIIYAVYFYPRRGIYVAAACGIAYQSVGYFYLYPNPVAVLGITAEAVLMVIIAAIITYFIGQIRAGEAQYRTVFENSQLGIILFERSGFAILKTNDKFAAMLHHTPQEFHALTFTDLLLNEREKERLLERIDRQPETADFETRFAEAGGGACWVNLSWSMIDENTVSCTAININARKLAEKLNNDNMMKYRQITEHSPTGILIIQNGKIVYANPSFFAFSGYPLSEITGRSLSGFIEPGDQHRFGDFTARWSQPGKAVDPSEFRFMAKNGEIRVGELYANPIIHTGKPAIMINLVDISEKLRLEDKIRMDNERRRGIISTVAHELRTPLQPILGYLNLLISDPQGFGIVDDTKKILERCLVSVDRERQIINQMLELSVLESGKLKLSISEFPFEPLVQGVLDTSGYPSKAEIRLDIPAGLVLVADRERLYNVLDSILSNAINYSKPPRKIEISYRSGGDDTYHHISVRDNGVGIPSNAIAYIFEPFQLADATKLSRKYDRIGLSLSIAKKVIQMHGGDITVESTENSGSTFTIHLPREMPDDV